VERPSSNWCVSSSPICKVQFYSCLQNLSRPPLSLPPTPKGHPLKVTLLVGSSQYDPLSVEVFDLVLPRSQPAPEHPEEVTFHPRPDIKHTFRPDHKLPPQFISAIFVGLVLSPWAVLLGLVRTSFAFLMISCRTNPSVY